MTPDSNQEVHGDQHYFPEKEKLEEIEGDKYADNTAFEHQQTDEEAAHAVLDGFPGSQDGNGRQKRREQDEKQADAVDPEVIVYGRRRNPVVEFHKLVIRGVQYKAMEQ